MKLSPSTGELPLHAKLAELVLLFRDHQRRRREPPTAPTVFDDISEYDASLARYGGPSLSEAPVFEIGYGPRPWRLVALLGMGVDARGVDAEVPILLGRPHEYREAFRRNGLERTGKSLVRRVLFDRRERAAFDREVERRGLRTQLEPDRFLVGDAADVELPDRSLGLIYSEDVFEHVHRDSLERLVPKMARWLLPQGLALIRPNVFSGITGGHLVEWYRHSFGDTTRTRRSEPWEHLRRARWQPNTHLNRMLRADYRELFRRDFDILEEVVKRPDLGREFLTPDVAAELVEYPEEELFSNQVLFVLRPRDRSRTTS
jgi:SAM-dependent methyltransferase